MSLPSELLFKSATELAEMIRKQKISCVDLTTAYLDRILAVNPSINAAVQICGERAIQEAEDCDKLLSQQTLLGPLHGIPMTIKDSLDTEGVISTGGTAGRRDYIPDQDATIVHRLRQAGAILLAKTNTPELTLSGETNNEIYGRTSNPYDLNRSPGGSSGGSAALLAAGGSALEVGSDTGGSIREPAHYCGVTGLKPTIGRIPRTGHIVPWGLGLFDELTVVGPMARYVDDIALTLPIISGPDFIDPKVLHPASANACEEMDVNKLRIAWYTDNGVIEPCEDIRRVIASVVEGLQQSGCNIEFAPLPRIPEINECNAALRRSDHGHHIIRLLQRFGTSHPGPDLQSYLTRQHESPDIDPVLFEKIDQEKSSALQFMQQYDAIICPSSHDVARLHGASANDAFETWSHITIYNLLGWPGISVRGGTSENGGLPVGVQVVAAPWREDVVIAVARKIEQLFGGFSPPEL